MWHEKQLVLPVGMWLPDRAVAVVPLWQLVQVVDAPKVLWSTRAPAQPDVLWQLSQVFTPLLLCTGVLGLPAALR